jgi:hypothetical protein
MFALAPTHSAFAWTHCVPLLWPWPRDTASRDAFKWAPWQVFPAASKLAVRRYFVTRGAR